MSCARHARAGLARWSARFDDAAHQLRGPHRGNCGGGLGRQPPVCLPSETGGSAFPPAARPGAGAEDEAGARAGAGLQRVGPSVLGARPAAGAGARDALRGLAHRLPHSASAAAHRVWGIRTPHMPRGDSGRRGERCATPSHRTKLSGYARVVLGGTVSRVDPASRRDSLMLPMSCRSRRSAGLGPRHDGAGRDGPAESDVRVRVGVRVQGDAHAPLGRAGAPVHRVPVGWCAPHVMAVRPQAFTASAGKFHPAYNHSL